MPKETFYNLSIEKREKIDKALENEFARTSIEKASISKIIEEAGIPRGSFYQYFEDKEDAMKYIIKRYISLEKETMKEILIVTKGNIFEAALKIFNYMTPSIDENFRMNLSKNIMQELRKNNVNVFNVSEKKDDDDEINQYIDKSILNLEGKEELKDMMKILSTITRTASINVCAGNMLFQDAKEELEKQIEILKKGMLKRT